MGEIAEMMIDGTLCEGCGVALDGDAPGYPRRCASCRKEQRAENHQATLARHQQVKKVPCPTCGKKLKAVGLADHQRDAHGVTPAIPTEPDDEEIEAMAMRCCGALYGGVLHMNKVQRLAFARAVRAHGVAIPDGSKR